MSNIIKDMVQLLVVIVGLFVAFLLAISKNLSAADWSQCPDSSPIMRCQTYNCPDGDTNGDGDCSLEDSRAKLTDYRNDALCANPPSGCGVVHYYRDGQANSCVVRVKENENNCNLYNASSPVFESSTSTPKPTATPKSNSFKTKGEQTANSTPKTKPTSSPSTKGGQELPETGPQHIIIGMALLLGFGGAALKATKA